MQSAVAMRQIFAGLVMIQRTQGWLADELGIPRSSLRNHLYRSRRMPDGQLEKIWTVMTSAGVQRVRSNARLGAGVRLVESGDEE
jgi:hypothetical protein